MRFGSVFSGIEAASVAWLPLGWEAAWFSEVESFCCAVLNHHYPEVPNLGDMTKIKEVALTYGQIDVLVGGSPCQSFSVAGQRGGLSDPRGQLAIEYIRLVGALSPRWVVWENVPGVLSADGGRAFGEFLGALAQCGYGFAYSILDASRFGVPQRRRRVFVVAYLGDWRPAAAVLFERESLRRDTPSRRKEEQAVAALTANGVGTCGADDSQAQAGHFIPELAGTLAGSGAGNPRPAGQKNEADFLVAYGGNNSGPLEVATARNAKAGTRLDFETETFIVQKAYGVSNDPTPKWAEEIMPPLQAKEKGGGRMDIVCQPIPSRDPAAALTQNYGKQPDNSDTSLGPNLVIDKARAFVQNSRSEVRFIDGDGNKTGALAAEPGVQQQHYILEPPPARVRRLTPLECERLQGFPDGWTAIPYRGKPAADGPRYRAIGNSIAIPCLAWIGQRIEEVDRIVRSQ